MKKIFQIILCSILIFFININESISQVKYNKSIFLNKDDSTSIRYIISKCVNPTDTLTKEYHNIFWSIVNNNGGKPENILGIGSKKDRIQFLHQTAIGYQKTFFEDALISLKTGKPFTSNKRLEYNKEIRKINNERYIKNNELMSNIAKKIPVPYNGQEIVFTEELVLNVLKNLDSAFSLIEFNLNLLYNKNSFN